MSSATLWTSSSSKTPRRGRGLGRHATRPDMIDRGELVHGELLVGAIHHQGTVKSALDGPRGTILHGPPIAFGSTKHVGGAEALGEQTMRRSQHLAAGTRGPWWLAQGKEIDYVVSFPDEIRGRAERQVRAPKPHADVDKLRGHAGNLGSTAAFDMLQARRLRLRRRLCLRRRLRLC